MGTKDLPMPDMPDKVREVMVSQASRRDAREIPDRQSLKQAIEECDAEHLRLGSRVQQIEVELSRLAARVRGQDFLPREEYARVCREQSALRTEKITVQNQLRELKLRANNLRRDYAHANGGGPDSRDEKLELTNRLLKAILLELRKLTSARGLEKKEQTN